jgi:PrtD family type I secretion system ABC transporter
MTMAVTGIGAYIVVSSQGRDMTTGGMIMSSILVGKALAPFDNSIELWKTINNTIKSYKRITDSFRSVDLRNDSMPIADVKGHLVVDNIFYAPPQPQSANPMMQNQQPRYILKGLSFSIAPGETLAIIGPSGAGKSTLAKVITGVWPVSNGSIRLDGADIYRWNRDDFGNHVGYLPQGIELFSGSIKQNIARLAEDIDTQMVEDCAKLAGAHDLILKFQNGYETDIGIAGSNLSGGQRQRIGLARAFYGNPKLVILDEPNANLDEAGEIALSKALLEAKKRNITAIVISHRPSVLSVVDKILVVQDGSVAAFGDKEEVISKIKLLNNGMIHIEDKK